MKKQLTLAAFLFAVFAGAQTAAKADDVWFSKYDKDHNGQWTYAEFKRAHSDYWHHHRHDPRLTDAELRSKFDGLDAEHHGWVTVEQARSFHNW
jgi:Ca2+-binding EF-hand superfamily protein